MCWAAFPLCTLASVGGDSRAGTGCDRKLLAAQEPMGAQRCAMRATLKAMQIKLFGASDRLEKLINYGRSFPWLVVLLATGGILRLTGLTASALV